MRAFKILLWFFILRIKYLCLRTAAERACSRVNPVLRRIAAGTCRWMQRDILEILAIIRVIKLNYGDELLRRD